jgi:hypothetical protein
LASPRPRLRSAHRRLKSNDPRRHGRKLATPNNPPLNFQTDSKMRHESLFFPALIVLAGWTARPAPSLPLGQLSSQTISQAILVAQPAAAATSSAESGDCDGVLVDTAISSQGSYAQSLAAASLVTEHNFDERQSADKKTITGHGDANYLGVGGGDLDFSDFHSYSDFSETVHDLREEAHFNYSSAESESFLETFLDPQLASDWLECKRLDNPGLFPKVSEVTADAFLLSLKWKNPAGLYSANLQWGTELGGKIVDSKPTIIDSNGSAFVDVVRKTGQDFRVTINIKGPKGQYRYGAGVFVPRPDIVSPDPSAIDLKGEVGMGFDPSKQGWQVDSRTIPANKIAMVSITGSYCAPSQAVDPNHGCLIRDNAKENTAIQITRPNTPPEEWNFTGPQIIAGPATLKARITNADPSFVCGNGFQRSDPQSRSHNGPYLKLSPVTESLRSSPL